MYLLSSTMISRREHIGERMASSAAINRVSSGVLKIPDGYRRAWVSPCIREALRRKFPAFCVLSVLLVGVLGRDFFRRSTPGRFACNARSHRLRIEETRPRRPGKPVIRETIPRTSSPRSSTMSACLTAASTSPTATPAPSGARTRNSCPAQASARQTHRAYINDLRENLPSVFPACSSSSPADIVTQILNFGTPAPSTWKSRDNQRGISNRGKLANEFRHIPGAWMCSSASL